MVKPAASGCPSPSGMGDHGTVSRTQTMLSVYWVAVLSARAFAAVLAGGFWHVCGVGRS